MTSINFSRRYSDFKNKFQQILGAKAQGYDELSALERPLVGSQDETDEYVAEHGVPPPTSTPSGAAGTAGDETHGARPRRQRLPATALVPTQADELREISMLGKDAAEILWEMQAASPEDLSAEPHADMREKAEQLQAQLRGLISDYSGGDETALASAFEAFDMLSRSLEAGQPTAPSATAQAEPPRSAQPSAEEPPLISFD